MAASKPRESILDELKRLLREVPRVQWEDVARECGIAPSFPRKVAGGERTNPQLNNVQPLLDYLRAGRRPGSKDRRTRERRRLASPVVIHPDPRRNTRRSAERAN